jgi:membrane protein implicated in regulation of membrane protease activity
VAIVWLVLGVVLALAEMFSTAFVLVMFAAGALAAAVAAAVGLPFWAQMMVFAGVSAAALAAVRPALSRRLHPEGLAAKVGLAAIQGELGTVLERIDLDKGMIKVDGETWSARSYDATQVMEPGERVRVIEIKGATVYVWRE